MPATGGRRAHVPGKGPYVRLILRSTPSLVDWRFITSPTTGSPLYHEVFDLLRPGGTFLNCDHVASSGPWSQRLFDDAMSEHLTVDRVTVQQSILPSRDRPRDRRRPRYQR